MIEDLAEKAARIRIKRDHLQTQKKDLTRQIHFMESEEKVLILSSELIKKLIDSEVVDGVRAVESLMSEGLKAVFYDQHIDVKAVVEEKRGKINVTFVTSQDGIEGKSLDSFGGAVSTVQSILLRLAILLRRGLRPILLLDESLPAFDAGYIHSMADFLSILCEKTGSDILLVTHNSNLVDAAHHSYRIRKKGDSARLDKI